MPEPSIESEQQQSGRLDRDSQYRIVALRCATRRAELREKITDDKIETITYATYFYNWLKGDGDGEEPELESS